MLFILSGQIQTGKTRWLEALIDDLSHAGVTSYGVLAPGIWRELPGKSKGAEPEREKLGINNVLLPSKNVISFAQRADLAQTQGEYNPDSQAGKMKLGWAIDDKAIESVNEHFAQIIELADTQAGTPGLLVIDELGQLELKARMGLTGALDILEAGPSSLMPHAIVVIREDLLPLAEGRFERWGDTRVIAPTSKAAGEIKYLYGVMD